MLPNKYRRKLDVIQQDKDNYSRHIARLEDLKAGWSTSIKHKLKEQKQLRKSIIQARKIHAHNRQHELSEQSRVRSLNKLNFKRVKSVIRNDFHWATSPRPSRPRKDSRKLAAENERLYEKILKTKPLIDNRNEGYTDRPINNNHLPSMGASIFQLSRIYETSTLNGYPARKVKLRFGKKITSRVGFIFNQSVVLNSFRDKSEVYALEVCIGDAVRRSHHFPL